MEIAVIKEPEAAEQKSTPPQAPDSRKSVAMQAGKRYKCAQCGSEMLVIKAGKGTLRCCGQEMLVK